MGFVKEVVETTKVGLHMLMVAGCSYILMLAVLLILGAIVLGMLVQCAPSS